MTPWASRKSSRPFRATPGRVVDVVERRRVEDQPAHRVRCAVDQRLDVVDEAVGVGVEQLGVVPEDDQARRALRDRARRSGTSARRRRTLRRRSPSGVYCRRMISRIDSTIARMMPCSTPTAKTTTRGDGGDDELAAPPARDAAQAQDVDQVDADEEHDRGEHRLRHVREQPGDEQHDEQHDHRHGQVGQLGAALLLVQDLGLGGAAVDDEGAGQPGGEVGAGQADDVAVDVDPLRRASSRSCATSPRSGR